MRESSYLLLFLPYAQGVFPPETFPSCLQGGVTWDISYVSNIIANVENPEGCQEFCFDDETCAAFTWSSAKAQPFPLSCALFSQTPNVTSQCEECVSGPPKCICSIPGECDITENNIIGTLNNITSPEACEHLCSDHPDCAVFTYLGKENHFSQTCFLFTSCKVFTSDCEDCISGVIDCDICKFDHSLPDGSCGCNDCHPILGPCPEGWIQFENNCYINLDNSKAGYHDIRGCRGECSSMGGSLASVHSLAEDNFIFSLIQDSSEQLQKNHQPSKDFEYRRTWLGAFIWLQWEWEDGTAWDYHNWNKGEGFGDIGLCIFLGDDFGQNEAEKWTDGVRDGHAPVFGDALS